MLSHELEIYVKGTLVFLYVRESFNFTMDDVKIKLKEKDRSKNINNLIGE